MGSGYVEGVGSTRRAFLQRGAGLAAGAMVGAAGLEVPQALARGGSDIDAFPGEIRLFAGDWVPAAWLPCRGGEFDRDKFPELARSVGNAFGVAKDGQFDLPDLRGRALLGAGDPPGGRGQRVGADGDERCGRDAGSNNPATLALTMVISPGLQVGRPMIGEIRPFALGFAPKDWYVCDGSSVSIANNSALFAGCGVNFGGNGRDSFNLPDLRGFTPVGAGDGPGLPATPLGSRTRDLAPEQGDRPPRLAFTHCIASQGEWLYRD
jgi:microcystin-dependent protein